MTIQENIILAGGLFGSIYLLGTSLNNLNYIYKIKDIQFSNLPAVTYRLELINTFTLIVSGISFFYLTYNAKKLNIF
jgi:hypothetical protein